MIGRFFSGLGERMRALKPTGLGERMRGIRLPSGISDRVRSGRYFFADLFYLLSRPFRGLGERLRPLWERVSPQNRRRLAALTGVVAVSAIVAFAVLPSLPCDAPGGNECAPEDDALALAPSDSLAYVHANIDPETEQYEDAVTVANRTPLLTQQVLGRILPFFLGASGEPPSFSEDIEPWFAGEIAILVVPGAAGNQQVQMLEVADPDGAREYESSISAGEPEPEDYQGVDIREDERGLATAIVDDFLVIGSAPGVRAVIDVSAGAEGADPLSGEAMADEALKELPEESLGQAYLSAEGIDSFLALSDGLLAPFEPWSIQATRRERPSP